MTSVCTLSRLLSGSHVPLSELITSHQTIPAQLIDGGRYLHHVNNRAQLRVWGMEVSTHVPMFIEMWNWWPVIAASPWHTLPLIATLLLLNAPTFYCYTVIISTATKRSSFFSGKIALYWLQWTFNAIVMYRHSILSVIQPRNMPKKLKNDI